MIFGFNGDLNNTKEFGIFIVLFLPTDFPWPSQTSPFSTVCPFHFSYIDLALLCVFQAYPLLQAIGLDVFMIIPQIHKWLTFLHVSQWSFHQWVFPWTSHKYNSKCPSPCTPSSQLISLHSTYQHLSFYRFTSLFMVSLSARRKAP